MEKKKRPHPGGAWFLPPLETCREKADANTVFSDSTPISKDRAGLHALVLRYNAALECKKAYVCPFSPHCKSFQETHRQEKIKKTIFDLLTKEQQDEFVNEALNLLKDLNAA